MENFIDCQNCKYFKESHINEKSILYSCEKKSKDILPVFGNVLDKSIKTCFVDKNNINKGVKRKWRKHYPQKSSKKS